MHISQDDVVRFLKRGFVWAFLVGAVVAAAVFVYRSDSPPVYESSTTVYAADNVVDLRSIGLSYLVSPSLHVSAYEAAARSDDLLVDALALLGIQEPTELDVEELRASMSLGANQESRLITLSARAGDPVEAAARAQAIGQALVSWDSQRPRENLMRMIEGLRQRIASLDVQISGLPAGPQSDSLSALRAEQVSQLATAVMLSDSVVGRLEIVQPAAVSDSPVAPSPVFDAVLAALVAVVLTYLVRLLVAIFDGRIKDPMQVPALTGLPVLAMFSSRARGRNNGRIAGAVGYLRSALVPGGSRPATILFATVGQSGSASRLALVMAESFARAGSATLLVSTVPRDPNLIERSGFQPAGDNTLETRLRNPDSAYSPFHVKVDGPGVLGILPSWEPGADSSELLSFGLQSVLQRWRQEYDVIIVATPSILEAADAVTVAPLVNKTVLVMDRTTKRSDLTTAVDLLRQRNVFASGVVITNQWSSKAPVSGSSAASKSTRVRRLAAARTSNAD